MNIDVIADQLQQDQRARHANADSRFPAHATFLKGGAHAGETVFFDGASLGEAKSLARVLNALPLSLGWQGETPVFAPAQLYPAGDAVEAGNCVLELLEDDSRFLHFWLEEPQGLLRVVVQLQGADGPSLSVSSSTRMDDAGRVVSARFGSLADTTGDALFARVRFEVPYGREATGFAFWAVRH